MSRVDRLCSTRSGRRRSSPASRCRPRRAAAVGVDQEPGPQGVADLYRVRRARGPGRVQHRPRPGGRLHRGSPSRLGRHAGRRRRLLPADGPRAGRQDDEPLDGHRPGRRRDADVQGRRRHHASRRTSAASGPFTVDRVEFAGLRPRRAGRRPRRLSRQGRRGAAVVWLGAAGPEDSTATYRRAADADGTGTRPSSCGAAASIGPARAAGGRGRRRQVGRRGRTAAAAGGRGGAPLPAADFTTVQRLDSPLPPNVSGERRVLRVPLQPRAGALRRAEAQGRGAGAAAVVPARRRDADVQHRRGLRGRPHAAHAERRGDRRGHRPAAEEHATSPSARTTITSATPKAKSSTRETAIARARRRRPRHPGRRRRSHLERRRRRRIGNRGADGAGARRSRRDRARSDRCCSSGTPAKSAACSARGTSPIIRPSRWTGSSRS